MAALRARLDRLEKIADRSSKEIAALKTEVATLVGVAADIKKRVSARQPAAAPIKTASSHAGRIISAVAGIALGVAFGVWFWTMTSTEPIVPVAPSSTVTEPHTPAPVQSAAPIAAPAIVPAVAVTPAHTAPAHAAPVPEPRQVVDYVGTLSIDSDPPGEVFIDRKAAGRTPMLAPNLKAGSHLIWIERDGFRRFTRVVQVPADRVSRVVADLEPSAR